MGANCCVAAKDKPSQETVLSTYRNARQSPSWSFRWDNKTHIEDIVDNPARRSHNNSGNASFESKSGAIAETEGLSDGGSPLNTFQAQQWHKSPTKTRNSWKLRVDARGQSDESDSSFELKVSTKSSCLGIASDSRPSVSVPSNPSSVFKDPSSSRSHTLPADPTSSKKARSLPGYQLSREISDIRIPSPYTLNENSSPEGRQSNDLSMGGSHGGSSDGWSMRMVSELASSQREGWSFDSDNLSSINSKIGKLIPQQPFPVSPDQQNCKICLKLLKKKSPWSSQKIVSTNELSVVAVLVCGHAYHAECLENLTPETDRYDPPCPLCSYGEKAITKLFGKVESRARSKISRVAVVADTDIDGDMLLSEHQRRAGKEHGMGASSSMKNSSSRPFLRRHFSIQLRPSRSVSVSENETTRKKGFWTKYLKN